MLRTGLLIASILLAATLPHRVHAEPTPQQAAYWWQDEIRQMAFAWSDAQHGRVGQWPRMTLPAGAIHLPVPLATGPIQADGKLDEPAWKHATRFPIGPIFDTWQQGPFYLHVSVCRDQKNVYLAVESTRDLAGLSAITLGGGLFQIDKKPFHASGHMAEWIVPLTANKGMTFPVEMVRLRDGKPPAELASLGLIRNKTVTGRDGRNPTLWLEPIRVQLTPSDASARLSYEVVDATRVRLVSEWHTPASPVKTSETLFETHADSAVVPYSWKPAEASGFSVTGFFHLDARQFQQTLEAARAMRERLVASGSKKLSVAPTRESLDALAAEPTRKKLSPQDHDAWRALACQARTLRARLHLGQLDAPLLFVKQHPYFAAHIYDDYYTWRPGGGLYIRQSPHDPSDRSVRPLIDPTTNETLGVGVYRDPEIWWDANRVLFAFKGEDGNTSLYEIDIDGKNLKRLTDSGGHVPSEATKFQGRHDVTPTYLADGRIAFTSTRPRALVPCFNSQVDTLHVMNGDGSGIRSISSNNVNEFDPAVMPDGRILYGRWEYVDKTALYMQSLWTMLPDGRMEEALFGNNLAKPTALLDARAVPRSHCVVASLTPHNGQAVGAIGMIDTTKGKNDLGAVSNFTPEYPVEMDQGLRTGPCDPWAISTNDLMMSNNALNAHSILELVDRWGHRELVHCDPEISCFAPMLIKPRPRPTNVRPVEERGIQGRFLLVDVYQGLDGIERGSIKRLRIVEETARTSGLPPGGRWWNQAFLVSWQGAYIVKNILGTVPVHEDGSAYFEAPSGRALYFEVLDAEGREIQRMRTFVQAIPGATRSCIGCHENRKTASTQTGRMPLAMRGEPARPMPESWGSGYVDYATMVQPVFDKHCVRCHGGKEGIARGLDLSGGWTWAFNISYESLIKHRLTGFLNCNNGSVHTSQILPPRSIGSGAAPLAETLIKKHPEVPRKDRDLIFAWMDTNSNYFGTWDYTPHATCKSILDTRGPLSAVMQKAGCTECHKAGHIGNDWVNLQTPEFSRILRAPMAKTCQKGLGVQMCRKRMARTGYPLITQRVQPPDVLKESLHPAWNPSGEPHTPWTSTENEHYQSMLTILRHARAQSLVRPRVDMPGAEVVAGECRMQVSIPVPETPPKLTVRLRNDHAVELAWQRTADTIGLQYELHRGESPKFTPSADTQIGLTTAGRFIDAVPPAGTLCYALIVTSGRARSEPVFMSLHVPKPPLPPMPENVTLRALPGELALRWESSTLTGLTYRVYRHSKGTGGIDPPSQQNEVPIRQLGFVDLHVTPGVKYVYTVRAIDRHGQEGPMSQSVEGVPLREILEPVFTTDFSSNISAKLLDGKSVQGKSHGAATVKDGTLEFGSTGFATFHHMPEFDLSKAFSLECWVRIDQSTKMPVVVAGGSFGQSGWFLQRYGSGWRWYLAPVCCDGGRSALGRWTHLVGTFDGHQANLFQDGKPVASVDCQPNGVRWDGPLVLGQYVSQASTYQVNGGLRGVKIYHRALRPGEVAEKFKAGNEISE